MIHCWFTKRNINSCIDSGKLLPHETERHIENCFACRQFYHAQRELAQQLTAGAASQRQPTSPFLHPRIMASINREPQMSHMERRSFAPIWALAMIFIGIGIFSAHLFRSRQSLFTLTNPQLSAPVMQQIARLPAAPSSSNLFELTKALDQPLEMEMQSVISDAKIAIHLLAQNFLPERSIEPR